MKNSDFQVDNNFFSFELIEKSKKNISFLQTLLTFIGKPKFDLENSISIKLDCYNNLEKPSVLQENIFSGLSHFQQCEILNFKISSSLGLIETLLYFDKILLPNSKTILWKVDVNIFYRYYRVR